MTTCPRCGRSADDEFVCADCGAFLAGGEGEPEAAVRVGRVAVLVLVVCLLAAVGAVVLLNSGGGGPHRANAGGLPVSGPAGSSSVPLGLPGEAAPASSPGSGFGPTATSGASSTSPTPKRSASRSAARTSARPSSNVPRQTSSTPHPSTSHPPPSVPPSTSQPPPVPPAVQLAKGASCGQHCYSLTVTLTGFGAGAHEVSCFSARSGEFGQYSTSATTSSGCTDGHPHDTVWVVVDGTRSNSVGW